MKDHCQVNRACLGGKSAIWLLWKDHTGELEAVKAGKSRCLTMESVLYPLGSRRAIWVLELRQDKMKVLKGKMEKDSKSKSSL